LIGVIIGDRCGRRAKSIKSVKRSCRGDRRISFRIAITISTNAEFDQCGKELDNNISISDRSLIIISSAYGS
uniref:VWFA domain-containing protein n=1 Tax=Ascaris lumbricoides TaxID=6252 RepID=A0A0M3IUQ5_ASCLU